MVLLEEAKAHVVAGEQELDDRLPVATAGLVEADRAALYTIKVRSEIACPEQEGIGGYRMRHRMGHLGGGSRDNGGVRK